MNKSVRQSFVTESMSYLYFPLLWKIEKLCRFKEDMSMSRKDMFVVHNEVNFPLCVSVQLDHLNVREKIQWKYNALKTGDWDLIDWGKSLVKD